MPKDILYPVKTTHKQAHAMNNESIDGCIASERFAIYPPAASSYALNTSQVKHSILLLVGLLAVGIAIFLNSFAYAAPGLGGLHDRKNIKANFFDLEFAEKVWAEAPTLKRLNQISDESGADFVGLEKWKKDFADNEGTTTREERTVAVAKYMKILENSPNSENIKKAHDLNVLYSFWYNKFFHFTPGRSSNKKTDMTWNGWNKWRPYLCKIFTQSNVFTNNCVIPDWRTGNDKIKALNVISSVRGVKKRDTQALKDMIEDESIDAATRAELAKILKQVTGK